MGRRWLIPAAAVALAIASVQAFAPLLGAPGGIGPFMDETQSVQVALNFLTRLHYSIDLWQPYAGAFYPEMSIGLLASLPSAIGWGVGGDLLAARIASIVYCLGLSLVVGYGAARAVLAAAPSVGVAVACLGCALALLAAPGAPEIIVHAQGEWSGAAWLGLGYLLLPSRPRTAALVLGLCVWHTKFIFVPFALAGLVWSAWTHESTLARRARLLAAQLALFVVPLLVWMGIIAVQIGGDGLLEWAARRVDWYGRGNSGLAGAPLVRGLQNRLAAPQLEWSHYSATTKLRILVLLFAPSALLAGAVLRRRTRHRREPALDALHVALALTLLAFAWWYFYWNQFMWVRHVEPALLVGFAVLAYFAMAAVTTLPPRARGRIAAIACAAIVVVALAEMPDAVAGIRALDTSVATACRVESSWQLGPWPRCMPLMQRRPLPKPPPNAGATGPESRARPSHEP